MPVGADEDSQIAKQIELVAAATVTPSSDPKAKQEEDALFRQRKRDENIRTVIHWVLMSATALIGGLIVVVLAVRIVYMVLPIKWQWLTPDQLIQVDHFLFSGFIGGVLTQAGRKIAGTYRVSDNDSES